MLSVMVAGRELTDFNAKMQSYPEITSCEVDTGIFQGANRSSLQLLHNRRGMRFLTCKIDFFGKDNFERTMHQSEFEALFLGGDPVAIDIGDGFWYRSVLVQIGAPQTERELITTVEYRFQVTRHRGENVIAGIEANDAKLWCQSNVAKTDCVVRLLYNGMGGASNIMLSMNGLIWHYKPVLMGDMVLDGVNKIFTVGGVNVNSAITWTDFPYLVPGENVLSLSMSGIVLGGKAAEVVYTPTFL